jgi:hypothetical protein
MLKWTTGVAVAFGTTVPSTGRYLVHIFVVELWGLACTTPIPRQNPNPQQPTYSLFYTALSPKTFPIKNLGAPPPADSAHVQVIDPSSGQNFSESTYEEDHTMSQEPPPQSLASRLNKIEGPSIQKSYLLAPNRLYTKNVWEHFQKLPTKTREGPLLKPIRP